MTCLPAKTDKKLGLAIDLDTCVGCNACVTACKGWNDQGYGAPLSDQNPYGADPSGAFLNRVHSYQVQPEAAAAITVSFPRSCLHCDDAPCVTVCPTGASYKRSEDGIVLVNEDACIGCGLCAWACPYGAREMDQEAQVMKKCTLCVDRIYNENLPEEDREPACVRTCPTGEETVMFSSMPRFIFLASARPMMTPTAKSITLPRTANALNSFNMLLSLCV